jgi:hypothetical protein
VVVSMTTKLSQLQHVILQMAYERRGRGDEQKHPTPVDLYYAESLTERFGFPTLRDPTRPGAWHFSRRCIRNSRVRRRASVTDSLAESTAAARADHRLPRLLLAVGRAGAHRARG